MKIIIPLIIAFMFLIGCGEKEEVATTTGGGQASGLTVKFEAPEAMKEPAYIPPKSDEDWKAKVNNKDIEVIQVINIINPVAAYITAGFEQYGQRIKSKTVHEEWVDTQDQLTKALGLYDSCKKRVEQGKFDKQLFLDMEGTWQLLVKTGVAGVRTKSMLDAELAKL
jgi:hypothetical protein